jgi:ABC-type multidrug transport system fused ATPase/permease subunit
MLICAKNIHNKMCDVLLKAPIAFFDSNPSGRILTRFSKDLATVDNALIAMFGIFHLFFFKIISVIIVVAIILPYSLIPAAILVLLMIYIRRYSI